MDPGLPLGERDLPATRRRTVQNSKVLRRAASLPGGEIPIKSPHAAGSLGQTQLFLALAQGLLGLDEFRHVGRHFARTDDFARGVSNRGVTRTVPSAVAARIAKRERLNNGLAIQRAAPDCQRLGTLVGHLGQQFEQTHANRRVLARQALQLPLMLLVEVGVAEFSVNRGDQDLRSRRHRLQQVARFPQLCLVLAQRLLGSLEGRNVHESADSAAWFARFVKQRRGGAVERHRLPVLPDHIEDLPGHCLAAHGPLHRQFRQSQIAPFRETAIAGRRRPGLGQLAARRHPDQPFVGRIAADLMPVGILGNRQPNGHRLEDRLQFRHAPLQIAVQPGEFVFRSLAKAARTIGLWSTRRIHEPYPRIRRKLSQGQNAQGNHSPATAPCHYALANVNQPYGGTKKACGPPSETDSDRAGGLAARRDSSN